MSVWREAMQARQTFIRLHQYSNPPSHTQHHYPYRTTTLSVKLYSRSNRCGWVYSLPHLSLGDMSVTRRRKAS